jgi:hypothetical protein
VGVREIRPHDYGVFSDEHPIKQGTGQAGPLPARNRCFGCFSTLSMLEGWRVLGEDKKAAFCGIFLF